MINHGVKLEVKDGRVKVADLRGGDGWALYWCPLNDSGVPCDEFEPENDDFIEWPFGEERKTPKEMNAAGFWVMEG